MMSTRFYARQFEQNGGNLFRFRTAVGKCVGFQTQKETACTCFRRLRLQKSHCALTIDLFLCAVPVKLGALDQA